jgi:Flp pilus assembly protein TadB
LALLVVAAAILAVPARSYLAQRGELSDREIELAEKQREERRKDLSAKWERIREARRQKHDGSWERLLHQQRQPLLRWLH